MGATVPPKMFNQPSPFGASNVNVIGTQAPTPGLDATSAAAQPGGSDTGSLQSYLTSTAVQGAPTTPTTSAPTTTNQRTPVRIQNPYSGLRGRLLFDPSL